MRCSVHASPSGGWVVRLDGADAPLSQHDTEGEALAVAAAYELGLRRTAGLGTEAVELRDGAEVLIRAVRARDKPLFAAGFQQLSDDSRYRRFMGHKRGLSIRELAFLTDVDHVRHEAIGAIDPLGPAGIGVARYVRPEDGEERAEAAVAIVDAWQGRGLGGILLTRLRDRALANGIDTFMATLLVENTAMLTLFRRLGPVTVRARDGHTLDIDVQLAAVDADAHGCDV